VAPIGTVQNWAFCAVRGLRIAGLWISGGEPGLGILRAWAFRLRLIRDEDRGRGLVQEGRPRPDPG